ncbi:hypothetical protein STUTZSP0542_40350 [Stutzerimonas marianensis]
MRLSGRSTCRAKLHIFGAYFKRAERGGTMGLMLNALLISTTAVAAMAVLAWLAYGMNGGN